MITDDARVVDAHSCQLETWGIYNGSIGEYWFVPGCNFFLGMEISLGTMMSNELLDMNHTTSRWGGRELVMGVKKVFKDLEVDGYSFGFALGNTYNFKRSKHHNDVYFYIPISKSFFDNRLLLHSNIGYKIKHVVAQEHIFAFGLGLEQQITQRLWILGESVYERLDTPKFQLGLRIWLLQDRIQLDGTYGNAFKGGQSWVSLGLRFLGPRMF